MIRISPTGLSAVPVANQLAVLVTFREKLCRPFCIDSSVQPLATIEYSTGTPVLNGTTVFVPITARITIVTPGCGCNAKTQLCTENFYAAFQGQTTLPTAVTITSVGRIQGGSCVSCGKASAYSINDSLQITLSPPATGG
jgi:hypothetical protein